jgi:hypothetical protein
MAVLISVRLCNCRHCLPCLPLSSVPCLALFPRFALRLCVLRLPALSCVLCCRLIDECATNNGGCAQSPFYTTTCENTVGSFLCGPCPTGWVGNNASGCTGHSYCLQNNGGCGPNRECYDHLAYNNFTCGFCLPGFKDAPVTSTCTPPNCQTCADVNECTVGNGGCFAPVGQSVKADCINTVGSWECGPCPVRFAFLLSLSRCLPHRNPDQPHLRDLS